MFNFKNSKMRKIIFLDIDGVLAIAQKMKAWGLVESKQLLLKEILDKTNAEIVLSSSWRLATVEYTKAYMTEQGFMFSDKIVGVTIRAYHYIDKKDKIHLSIPRGVEIQQWIDTNIHSDNGKNFQTKELGKDYNYVIIDDDNDMLYTQSKNFIQTDPETGITESEVQKAIQILNPFTKEEKEKIQEVVSECVNLFAQIIKKQKEEDRRYFHYVFNTNLIIQFWHKMRGIQPWKIKNN
jgi:hypothetical protein